MATGGIFTLITNDGKQDRMLMATHLLNRRLRDIRCAKQANGDVDPTPTLMDIEKTHILFMNAHFKPFAAIGYEYNKVRPQSGNAKLGGSAQFSIPQFGDFFHDMALHVIMDAPTVTALAGIEDDEQDYIKFADFLGHRLVKKVKMEVNGNPPLWHWLAWACSALAHFVVAVPPSNTQPYEICRLRAAFYCDKIDQQSAGQLFLHQQLI